jgi:RNA polymerase sigma factor (sigma-70 family)
MRRRGPSRDDDGFGLFVAAHERRLRQALTALLGPVVGREATVEALSYGWEHWSRVSTMDNPVGYLYVVGRERATRFQRRRRDRPVECPEQPTDDPTIWFEPALPGLVEDLSDRERQVVMLVHGFEWSLNEVAELLEVSKSTVQTYAERGLSKLRDGLGVTS